MYWEVTAVKPIEYLTLKVTFNYGLEGTVHFIPSHLTGVFESLKDKNYFDEVSMVSLAQMERELIAERTKAG